MKRDETPRGQEEFKSEEKVDGNFLQVLWRHKMCARKS